MARKGRSRRAAARVENTNEAVQFEALYLRDVDGDPKRAQAAARALTRDPRSPWSSVTAPKGMPGRLLVWDSRQQELLTPAQAWSVSRQIEEDLETERSTRGVTVEPLFEFRGSTIDETTGPSPRPKRAKGGGSDKPLPCARDNPLWSLELCRVPAAWALPLPSGGRSLGEGIRVAHPDTGYTKHPEIWAELSADRRVLAAKGFDFLDDDGDATDPLTGEGPGHGTATASVIMSDSASTGPTFVTGVAPRAELVPLRVGSSVVHFSFANLTRSLYHAVNVAGAHLISMSLGGPFASGALEDAIDHAIERDVILLAAAGNQWPWVVYPARYSQVVAVAACNCRMKPWDDSASGSSVDVTGPGESVWRAASGLVSGASAFSVSPGSGTSYAVATVAGVCALWLGHFGRANLISRFGTGKLAANFRRLLVTQGVFVPQGWDTSDHGAGIVDAHRLLGNELGPAPKSTLRRGKAPVPEDRVERALEFFASQERVRVERFLDKHLGQGKSRRRTLARVGEELVFQLATNPAFRARALGQSPSRAKIRAKARAKTVRTAMSAELESVFGD